MELVDILKPPTFEKTGEVKPVQEALDSEDWLGTFNLWVIRTEPELSFLFQKRTTKGLGIVGSGKLDVAAGGFYSAGEEGLDGLREAKEELGKDYNRKDIINLGRRIHVGFDSKNRKRQNVVHVYAVIDNTELSEFNFDKDEIDGLFICSIKDFIELYSNPKITKIIKGIGSNKETIELEVNKDSFFYNWDDYYLKMCVLAERILAKESILLL